MSPDISRRVEASLIRIIGTLRLTADALDSEADGEVFAGRNGDALRARATHLRWRAACTVADLARAVRRRWESPEYVAQTEEIQRGSVAMWLAEREKTAERLRKAAERVAARRARA